MEKRCINVEGKLKAGPYSNAVEAGGLVFLSGLLPVDPHSGETVNGDIGKATARVLDNVRYVLGEAGLDLDRVVKTTIFLKDMADFKAVNEVYAKYFAENQPARSCVAVKELPGNHRLEIEVVALK